MAAEWYYTTNKQQMGPVSWDELRHLAAKSLLKPDDLVWTEGMAEWVKAVRQQGLFQDSAAPAESVKTARADTAEAPLRKSSARRRIDEELDEIDDEARRDRRQPRKASGNGLKIGLIVGAIVLVVMLLGCGVAGVLLIVFGMGGGGAGGNRVPTTYTLNLAPNAFDQRSFNLRAGQRVTITVNTSRAGAFQPMMSVEVVHRGRPIATAVSNRADCSIAFVAPANDNYLVRVHNRGPVAAASRVDVR